MKKPPHAGTVFFIVGLPRSRTAWLANFLSVGDTFCHHDLWSKAGSLKEFTELLWQPGASNVGNSDPANALHFDALTQEYPDAEWLIVNRPIGEVHTSCRRAGLADMTTLETLARKVEEVRACVPPGQLDEVDFVEVNAASIAPWARLKLHRWESPVWRNQQLDMLNVQTHAPAALAKIAELTPAELCPVEPLALSEANQRYLGLVRQMCGVQQAAFAWFLCVLELATVWDHCIDGDGVAPAMADRVFTAVTTEWPMNEWWLTHRAALVPALVAARSAWRWSNRPDAPKFKAYDLYTELPAVMAWLIGGNALVETALPGIRECALALLAEDERRDGGKK